VAEASRNVLTRLLLDSQQALRRYVRRLVRHPQATEDIVQEALLRTYEQGAQVQMPRAFLFSTARNLAFDASRRKRAQRTDSMGDLDVLGVISPGDTPDRALLADEQSRLLREAIERLTPQCRTVFALRVFQDCSYKDIARSLGLSPKTVENHVARALRETHQFLRRRYDLRLSDDHG